MTGELTPKDLLALIKPLTVELGEPVIIPPRPNKCADCGSTNLVHEEGDYPKPDSEAES